MGLFDFFRREKPVHTKQVKFDELKDFISKKRREINISEIKAIGSIKDRINLLLIEFENEILAINQINLDEKKADEKFKLVVKGNLNRYADHLKNLKNNLENLQFDGIQDLVKKIDSTFHDFKKRSFMNFEKATFLIGKELGNVIESIKKFYRDFKEILSDNKELIDNSKILSETEAVINRFMESEQIKNNLYLNINNIEKKVNDFKININMLKKRIEETIKSKEYNEELRKKQEFENKKEKLRREIANLKEIINLKELAGIYHSNEKEMRIIKEHWEDFYHAFEKDNGEAILKLVDKNKWKIQEMINKIIEKQKEITGFVIEEDKVLEIKSEIKKMDDKINELSGEKSKIEKKISQFEEKINDARSMLRQELIKLNLELV